MHPVIVHDVFQDKRTPQKILRSNLRLCRLYKRGIGGDGKFQISPFALLISIFCCWLSVSASNRQSVSEIVKWICSFLPAATKILPDSATMVLPQESPDSTSFLLSLLLLEYWENSCDKRADMLPASFPLQVP